MESEVSQPSLQSPIAFAKRFLLPHWDNVMGFILGSPPSYPTSLTVGMTSKSNTSSDESANHPRAAWISTILLVLLGCAVFLRVIRRNKCIEGPKHASESKDAVSTEKDGTIADKSKKREDKADGKRSYHNLKRNGNGDSDPGLLKKHSSYVSYSTSIATYPSIRTFFCPHPHIDKLPATPAPLPLLVFVHGLGGSLAQFNPLLTTLTNVGPCFGIDFPGCGLSSFSPNSWPAYSTEALAALLAQAIEQHRDASRGQRVVLIAHSVGCSISAVIASSESRIASALKDHILGLIALCPVAAPPSAATTAKFRRLLYVPGPLFDIWRRWDRRGGPNSQSVSRLVGDGADLETRKLQLRFNEQSRTPVWRRMAWGTLPTYDDAGKPTGGIPGKTIWAGIQNPILLIAGESDPISKPIEVSKILEYFGISSNYSKSASATSEVPGPAPSPSEWTPESDVLTEPDALTSSHPTSQDRNHTGKIRSVKAFVFPTPASHALLFDRATYRTLSGLIQGFLDSHVDHRLNIGWQLQHLTTSGKWDVKNLVKWQAVKPVSDPIAGTFVAMKTLREVDEEHSPIPFVKNFKGKIYAIVDISHESPVYDPTQLDNGGIQYHKLPSVSKVPPATDEVRDFVALIDRLQSEISAQGLDGDGVPRPLIGVHCHYGFNRTGFFLVSYLIERKGYGVQAALDEFEQQRAPGIRHAHFIDTLFVRYCMGLKRTRTQ